MEIKRMLRRIRERGGGGGGRTLGVIGIHTQRADVAQRGAAWFNKKLSIVSHYVTSIHP